MEKIYKFIISILLSMAMFNTIFVEFNNVLLAEETTVPQTPIDIDENQYIPINTSSALTLSPDQYGRIVTVFLYITGSFDRGTNSVSNINLSYSSSVLFNEGEVTNLTYSYNIVGNQLYVHINVNVKITIDGIITYASGGKTIVL